MSTTDASGVRIAWSEQGSGTPVLLVMGHSFTQAQWWPVAPDLAAEHRVVTFDNRGVGESELGPAFTVPDMVRDCLAVMDAAGIEDAHVYGVSMGGGIVLELAMAHPERVRSLVLGCTMAKTEVIDPPSAWMKLFVRLLPKGTRRKVSAKRLYSDGAPADRVAEDQRILAESNIPMTAYIAQAEAIAAYSTSYDRVRAVTAPTLVLHGTDDPAVAYAEGQRLAELIPGAQLVTYEGARHNYLIDHGDHANATVLEFFAQVDAAREQPVALPS